MSTTKDFTKKVVLTQTQFDARQAAGTLQEGVEYCISDYSPSLTELGVTATASELNTLDGITATTTELNYCDGVTSNIQTQLNGKELQTNKVTSILSSSTDTQYPSAAAVYTFVNNSITNAIGGNY